MVIVVGFINLVCKLSIRSQYGTIMGRDLTKFKDILTLEN